jgi:glycosyltransferase involved in cell wall biosynthesis
MMEGVLWGILIPYCALLLWIIQAYRHNRRLSNDLAMEALPLDETDSVSVVVAMRNESSNIETLLDCLARQTLSPRYWELCLVDDHSTDSSKAIAENWARRHPGLFVKVLTLPASMHGKKAAITYGIQHSRHPFICCTDADCRPSARWLELMTKHRKKNKLAFIGGLVRLHPANRLVERLQSLEMIALTGTGAALLQRRIPGMCNGANLAFEQAAFWQVGGYEGNEHIPTGDDEFLLQKIARLPGKPVGFLNHPEAVVYTHPCHDWYSWIEQRKRWISKWKYHQSGMHKLLGAYIGLLYLSWLAATAALILNGYGIVHFAAQCAVKFSFEFVFLYALSKPHRQAVRLLDVLLLFLVYPFYAAYFVWVGSRTSSYTWKDRRVKV